MASSGSLRERPGDAAFPDDAKGQASAALRRDLSDVILQSMGSLIVVIGMDARIVRFNRECERLAGYKLEEIASRPFFEMLIPEEEQAMVQEELSRLYSGCYPSNLENHWITRSGERRLIRWSNNAILDEHGAVEYVISVGVDITEQRQTEIALRESQERYAAALAGSSDGIWDWDLRKGTFYFSRRLLTMLGYEPGDLEENSNPFYSLLHPSDRSIFEGWLSDYLAGRILALQLEVRARKKSGDWLWILVRGAAMRDADGRPYRMAGSFTDVSERREQLRLLRESEARSEQAESTAKLGSWEIDLATRAVNWSNQVFALFDLHPKNGVPSYTQFLNLLTEPSRKALKRALYDVKRLGKPLSLEVEARTARGGLRAMRVRGRPMFYEGRVVRLSGSIQDFTDEKHAARRLTSQEAFLRNVIDTDPNLIFVKDYEGRFLLANRAVAAAYGTTPDKLIGKYDSDFNPCRDEISAFAQADRQVINTGVPMIFDECVTTVAGPRWLHTVKCPIIAPTTGERQVLGISVDITDRVFGQQELEAARQTALESSRMKSEFLANMSHEIRTPMNGVIGMADLLIDSRLDPEQLELAQTIRESADSLLTILNDILDFSKIEAGKMSFESIPVDLADLLERVALSFAPRAEEKGLKFSIDIDWRQNLTFATDPVRLRQILTNLIGNAVKFTDGGEVRVSLTLFQGKPRFDIRDTGIGIADDRLQTVFGAFTQADGSTTRKYGGTGLGLAIAQQLAQLLGGNIVPRSQYGLGSTFTLHLDIPHVTTFEDDRRLLGTRVAILIDDPRTLAFARAALLSLGAAVVAPDMGCDLTLTDAFSIQSMAQGTPSIALLRRGIAPPPGVEAIYEPLTRKALLDAVMRGLESRKTGAPIRVQPGRILLVEDNPVNQRVAARLLQRYGMEVELAENGEEAIERTAESRYDLVLMDVQMPKMDGLEATRRIRERDDAIGRHIPIVAMTAHAMEGDRERCLAAGMDDYLSKPLRREDLQERIAAWIDTPETVEIGTLDETYIRLAFGDDEAFFAEVLQTYIQATEEVVERIQTAIAENDLDSLRDLAHTLKGSSRSIGANEFAEYCQHVERAASEERIAAANELLRLAPRVVALCRMRLRQTA